MAQGLALFKERVRPLLIAHCLDCHGGKTKKGDFDLSDRAPLIESGVIDGGAKASRLYALITHADEPHMPSKKPKLPAADIDIIARWIDLGAPYDKPLIDSAVSGKAAPKTALTIDEARNYWAFRGLEPFRRRECLQRTHRGSARRSIALSWRSSNQRGSHPIHRPSARRSSAGSRST